MRFFAGKALLAFITCFCGAYYFAEMLEADEYAFWCALFAGLSCAVFLVLFGLFRRRNVFIFTAAAALVLSPKWLSESVESFYYHILKVADGELIDADSLLSSMKRSMSDPMPMLLVLSVLFGFIFAVSAHHRFNPEAILTYSAVMVIPSFLAQHTEYTPRLGIFIAGLAALWSVSLASSANASLAVGGVANISVLDRQYRKNSRSRSPAQRIKADSLHYNRYFSDSAVIFISALLTVSIAASVFPKDGNLKLDTVVQKVSECVKNVGVWTSELFDSLNASPYKGFFSADGGSINISNGINPDDTPQSNTPVLEIITQSKDKLYLRGDVGYEFDGKRWKTIADINYDALEYSVDRSYYDTAQDVSRVKLTDALESYAPEAEYYLMRKYMGENPSERSYIELQKVKINYLQRLNTVIFAGTPANYLFRGNEQFSVKGDFVALADKGRINSMETTVLYQCGDPADMFAEYYNDDLQYYDSYFEGLPLTYDDYLKYGSAYQSYVYDYYTSIPDDERRTIVNLLWQSEFNTEEFESVSYNAEKSMPYRARLAEFLEEYFISGKYEYSLSADNFEGGESPLYTFLFETKSGHCAMYASAMCLLLRYFGVPARYVTGFTVGGDNCSEISGGYKYTVLQKNLHAWVEVYYDGVGWIPYDPTPSGDRRTGTESSAAVTTEREETTTSEITTATTAETTSTTTAEATEESTESDTLASDSDTPIGGVQETDPRVIRIILITAGTALLLFVIAMSVMGVIRSLNRKHNRKMKFFKSGEACAAVKEMLEFSLKLLEIRGIFRQNGETPEEFGFRADKALKAGNIFRDAVPFYERAEFDKAPEFTEEERLLVYESASKLLKNTLDGMKPLKKFVTRIRLFGKTNRS
ncbi:MAG: DUF3488 and transglutaminase-like domain-containing protein [Bacteroides sp.]|nr:DUF3488 and transglutaminase-like domain-containing protein [Bacteroides sp.]